MLLALLKTLDLEPIYWQPWKSFIQDFIQSNLSVKDYLNQIKATDLNKVFVAQNDLPEGQAYENFIHIKNKIPTRENLHDLFNGFCWCFFPQTKLAFNQLHRREIEHTGIQNTRGKVRDALTILDENGLLLQTTDRVWQAIHEKQWQRAFVEYKEDWATSQTMILGHALAEKLVQPYKGITAHVLRIPNSLSSCFSKQDKGPHLIASHLEPWDHYLKELLTAEYLAKKPYCPLPIFGIPGWHSEQDQMGFYEDKQVFRAPRSSRR